MNTCIRKIHSFAAVIKTTSTYRLTPFQLTFSHWSRKAYAVFCSLGKSVRISVLDTAITTAMASKNGTSGTMGLLAGGLFTDLLSCFGNVDDPEIPDSLLPETGVMVVARTESEPAACSCIAHIFINPVHASEAGFFIDCK